MKLALKRTPAGTTAQRPSGQVGMLAVLCEFTKENRLEIN